MHRIKNGAKGIIKGTNLSKEKNIRRITEITMHTMFSCLYSTSRVVFLPEE